jgi:hypothetical protein
MDVMWRKLAPNRTIMPSTAQTGPEAALELIDHGLSIVSHNSERLFEAELYRLKARDRRGCVSFERCRLCFVVQSADFSGVISAAGNVQSITKANPSIPGLPSMYGDRIRLGPGRMPLQTRRSTICSRAYKSTLQFGTRTRGSTG